SCDAKDEIEGEEGGQEVRFSAYADADGEYEEFFRATPYGDAKLGILNGAAADFFEKGATYRVTFEKVD
ncbi:hypothetical protein LCGC14_2799490, partial [marine sediment metagenome]